MNAFDTQLDVLKFLQGSQLDDALTLVCRRFKTVIEGHRDQLPLRALRGLCVDAKCARGPKFYEVTIESDNLPSRAQTFQASTLTSAIGRAFDFCKNCAIDRLSLNGGRYGYSIELNRQLVAHFVERLQGIPIRNVAFTHVATCEKGILTILEASGGVSGLWLDKLSFSATDEFVAALSRHGISSLTMKGRHVTFEGISEFCRGTTMCKDKVRMLRLYALSNVQKVVDEIIKFFLNDKNSMPLILHLESEEEVDAASYASNAVDCGTLVRYTFTKVPLTMIIDDKEVYFFRGSQFPDLARSIPKRIAEHITT